MIKRYEIQDELYDDALYEKRGGKWVKYSDTKKLIDALKEIDKYEGMMPYKVRDIAREALKKIEDK